MSKTFQKIKLPGRDNKPVKYKKIPYPQPREGNGLPLNFFLGLCIGARGSGKTVSCVKLIKYYETEGCYNEKGERIPIRTILISPTYQSNPIFDSLNSLDEDDIYEDYSDSLLLEILDQIEEEKHEILEYQEKLRVYKKFLRTESANSFTQEELIILNMLNFEAPIKPRFTHPPIIHLIFDDLVGTQAFKTTGRSALTNLAIKNRHKGINMWILSQSSKQIPKIIRINASLLLLYKFNSDEMLDDLYETVSGCLTKNEFQSLYDHATLEKYNFLCVDTTKKDTEIKQNFEYLFVLKKTSKKSNSKKIQELINS